MVRIFNMRPNAYFSKWLLAVAHYNYFNESLEEIQEASLEWLPFSSSSVILDLADAESNDLNKEEVLNDINELFEELDLPAPTSLDLAWVILFHCLRPMQDNNEVIVSIKRVAYIRLFLGPPGDVLDYIVNLSDDLGDSDNFHEIASEGRSYFEKISQSLWGSFEAYFERESNCSYLKNIILEWGPFWHSSNT
ncbi:hypothetical protein [Arthrobacter sp. STN4]|uniref:hypothetical protein n=1 Tax=Arthrobacter sp. STN4 TaxID=2923276 RepID=UPI002119D235|nr:hypothetical protein [Arthrobacter sp. STN4]MCQ9165549.1 hypothetical protein [Arthrobacter sp. STN4]